MRNPVLERLARASKPGAAGRRSERGVAKQLQGRLTKASGAMDHDKGDMTVGVDWLMECKSTQQDSMGLKLNWLCKIKQEALESNRTPALAISFTDAAGKPVRGGQWVAVPLDVFRELTTE